ncbi:unnamed protein product [Tilletia controversa]|uniref:DUF7702 domain-containing protein n=2 Tax=Tilletia TaxID=13289 RepID=A0A8X7SYJ6_9BASI|nr:hypothetical protein CF336_g2349 [Tilletia laevis]KAE8202490.1 hypothetical protein CF328_g2184 [Tilletia controversa]KAE8263667.1 hypothetical protein A4X03_0g1515 [Tilletia caries]KAE8206909.1 hypothetical protein CF335_g1528 [Tilletia laevis]KAE8252301.1 hypothetical protein A4X06_0g2290 [Tilletia controversa]
MTPPITTAIIIDIVFIPIYAILAPITLYNFLRLRTVKISFGTLLAFAIVRLAGNILSVAAWVDSYKTASLLTWGTTLSIIGYSFVFSAGLAMYNGSAETTQNALTAKISKIIHLVNTVGTVLLIIGITKSNDVFTMPPPADASLSKLCDVGTVLYIIITVVLAGLALMSKMSMNGASAPAWAPLMLNASLIALPFLAIRLGWTCYSMFGSHIVNANVWARLICAGIVEVVLLVIFNLTGFKLAKHFPAMLSTSPARSSVEEPLQHPEHTETQQQYATPYYSNRSQTNSAYYYEKPASAAAASQ